MVSYQTKARIPTGSALACKRQCCRVQLSGADQQLFEGFAALFLSAVGLLLAAMQYGVHGTALITLDADLLFAMHADAEGAVVDASQGRSHIAEQIRLTVEVANREFTLGGVLYFV